MWRWFDIILNNKSNIMDYYLNPPIRDGLMDFQPLELGDLSGAFYLWALGLLIAIFVFFCEFIPFYIKNRRQPRKLKNIHVRNSDEPDLIFPELLAELPGP